MIDQAGSRVQGSGFGVRPERTAPSSLPLIHPPHRLAFELVPVLTRDREIAVKITVKMTDLAKSRVQGSGFRVQPEQTAPSSLPLIHPPHRLAFELVPGQSRVREITVKTTDHVNLPSQKINSAASILLSGLRASALEVEPGLFRYQLSAILFSCVSQFPRGLCVENCSCRTNALIIREQKHLINMCRRMPQRKREIP
jgi:hypothetical protein